MKTFWLALASSMAVSAVAVAPAMAQNAPTQNPDLAKFQSYVTSEQYKDMLGKLSLMGQQASTPSCKEPKPKSRAELTMFVPPHFVEGQTHPTQGLWRDRVSVDACGKTGYQNILIQAQGTNPPRVALLMPGTTMINPAMQNKLLGELVQKMAANKCTDQTKIAPKDTKITKEVKKPKLDARGIMTEGQWIEDWSFNACGKEAKFQITYTAHADGSISHKIK